MPNAAPITYQTQQLFKDLNELLTRNDIQPAATDTDYFDLLRCSATPIGNSFLDKLLFKEKLPKGHFAYLLSLVKENNIQVTDLPEKAPDEFTRDDLNRWCLACYKALLTEPGCLSNKTHLNLAKLLTCNNQNNRAAKLIRKKVINIEKQYHYDEVTTTKLVANLFILFFTEDNALFSQLIDVVEKVPLRLKRFSPTLLCAY